MVQAAATLLGHKDIKGLVVSACAHRRTGINAASVLEALKGDRWASNKEMFSVIKGRMAEAEQKMGRHS